MNKQEKQLLPCPECGGQRYCAENKSIELSNNLGFTGGPFLRCDVVICTNCGYTAWYVSNPMEQIARLEASLRNDQERLQKLYDEDAQREAKRKRGFFRFGAQSRPTQQSFPSRVGAPPDQGVRDQCPVCGASIRPDDAFCLECGHRIVRKSQ